MIQAPQSESQKRLLQAARQAQGMGVVTLVLACFSIPGLLAPRVAGGPGRWSSIFDMLIIAVPAMSLLAFAFYLRRGHYWAVIATLVIASLGALFSLFTLGLMFFMSPPTKSNLVIVVLLPFAIFGLFLVGFGRLIYYLIRSILAIRRQAAEEQRGFALDVTPPPNPTL